MLVLLIYIHCCCAKRYYSMPGEAASDACAAPRGMNKQRFHFPICDTNKTNDLTFQVTYASQLYYAEKFIPYQRLEELNVSL